MTKNAGKREKKRSVGSSRHVGTKGTTMGGPKKGIGGQESEKDEREQKTKE